MIAGKLINIIRKSINILSPEMGFYRYAHFKNQKASNYIKTALNGNDPVMISRFGSNELDCLCYYLNNKRNQSSGAANHTLQHKEDAILWDDKILHNMFYNTGLFPPTPEMLEKFSLLILNDIAEIDILGSWMKKEKDVFSYMKNPVIVKLHDLEPYYHDEPWSIALKGKRVLVVHPFEKSIQKQYEKRPLIFANNDVLPEFDLYTLKAIQTIAGERSGFNDWFDALDSMCNAISGISFDVALIGCGAYGLPLAAHVKRMGKKAVHIGGALQILFGIKGGRWESYEISKLFNEYWVRPLEEETPRNAQMIEGGCYW